MTSDLPEDAAARIPAGAHADVLRWLSRDLDGELGAREKILLADHLDGCPRCAQVGRQLRGATNGLRAAPRVRTPVGLVDRIVAHTAAAASTTGGAREVAAGAGVGGESRGGELVGRVLSLVPLVAMLRRSAALAAAALVMVGGVYVTRLPKEAYADSRPAPFVSDPALERVLDRWERGRRADPSFFELLLAPDRSQPARDRGSMETPDKAGNQPEEHKDR